MNTWGKVITLVLVALLLTMALIIPSVTNAQTTSHYGANVGDSGANLVGYTLTTYSPDNQTVYANTMPLIFNMTWIYGLIPIGNAKLSGVYTYSIDNNRPVTITANQSSNARFAGSPWNDFEINPTFLNLIDISSLTNGSHELVITAGMYYNFSGRLDQLFNESATPVLFSVVNTTTPISTPTQNPTPNPTSTLSPTPTPTVPEFSWLMILPLFIFMLSIAVIVKLRKT
jgi:hypothetical protein